jgi:glycosyltransferase involved in cell wall biosynthesis
MSTPSCSSVAEPEVTASVLQVITSTDRRGAEVAASELGAELAGRGRRVETVALWPGTGGARLELPSVGHRRRDPRAVAGIASRARPFSVVVGHGSSTLPFGAAASAIARRPFVYRSIGDPAYWASSPWRRARVRTALGRARIVVALWPAAGETLRQLYRLPADRVRVIPTGVPADRFHVSTPEDRAEARRTLGPDLGLDRELAVDPGLPLAGYVGALSSEKDPLLAVEAMAARPGLQLIVAGSGPLRAEVEARATEVAPGRVWVIGSVADPRPILRAVDALVVPSHSEGIPAVAIEAGLSGVPVVAAAVGGLPEVVADGETGALVSDRTPRAFGDALWSVAAGESGAAMGAAARQRCLERFSLDAVASAWEEVLDGVTTTVRRR